MSHNTKVYRKQGGDQLVVASGGAINVETGGQVLVNGTQAAAIADVADGATQDAEARTAVNAILAVLRGAGIIASA